MITRHKQRGMSFLGWLIIAGLVGTMLMVGLKLLPAYMEFFKVRSTIESVANEIDTDATTAQIQQMIAARFLINDVRTIRATDVAINREGNTLSLMVSYEYRTPIMGNVDAVVIFEKFAEAGAR